MLYRVAALLLAETFNMLRECGAGMRECQVLWISDWARQEIISSVVHPLHSSHAGGFQVASNWINQFWQELSRAERGIRAQIHTHPAQAFHSATDDAFPIIHSVGFLSLVIPHFARGPVGFDGAYLAEIGPTGAWRRVAIDSRLVIV